MSQVARVAGVAMTLIVRHFTTLRPFMISNTLPDSSKRPIHHDMAAFLWRSRRLIMEISLHCGLLFEPQRVEYLGKYLGDFSKHLTPASLNGGAQWEMLKLSSYGRACLQALSVRSDTLPTGVRYLKLRLISPRVFVSPPSYQFVSLAWVCRTLLTPSTFLYPQNSDHPLHINSNYA